jgi:hypothetical protein
MLTLHKLLESSLVGELINIFLKLMWVHWFEYRLFIKTQPRKYVAWED